MDAIAATLTLPSVVGRLAPSPTGALHVGNARSFLLAWLSLRQQSGRVLLRIEDLDSPRIKSGAAAETVADLAWLGLDWDSGPEDRSPDVQVPLVQSQRLPRYREVLEQLIADGKVYPCTCSRAEVARAASAPHEQQLEGPVYPGTCRGRVATPPDPTDDREFAWRWAFTDQRVTWHDALAGTQQAHPATQLGDFVIARSDFTPAYQLAVVVDDHDAGVTEVVRGNDLIFSTYRQLAIWRYFDWTPPTFIHLPLLIGADGRRLAKRHGDTRLRFLKEQGITPEAVVGWLAWSCQLLPEPCPISPRALVGRLDWSCIDPQPTVVDQGQLVDVLRQLSRQ